MSWEYLEKMNQRNLKTTKNNRQVNYHYNINVRLCFVKVMPCLFNY